MLTKGLVDKLVCCLPTTFKNTKMRILMILIVVCGFVCESKIASTVVSKQKHNIIRAQKHLNTPESGAKYGIDLPAFAFDYSEYFSGAVIERSESLSELHLALFLLRHKSTTSNNTFDAVSTEEEVLYSWSQAMKTWGTKSTSVSSGLMCVLHNNDGIHSPYVVAAHWVRLETASSSLSAGATNNYKVLRCKIRGAAAVYGNLTHADTDRRLFVDVVHGRSAKHHQRASQHTSETSVHDRNSNVSTDRADAGGAGSMAGDPSSVLISFSVPWRSRQTGYPLMLAPAGSQFDPWQRPPGDGSGSVTHLCVAGLRPTNPYRSEVGLPMLAEFVQHHLLLGARHIFLAVQLDWSSPHMQRHLRLLGPFIEAGQVSVASMAPSGTPLDDVAGLAGAQLQDAFADVLFLNQCLYLAKGVASQVAVVRATSFIAPATGSPGSAPFLSNDLFAAATPALSRSLLGSVQETAAARPEPGPLRRKRLNHSVPLDNAVAHGRGGKQRHDVQLGNRRQNTSALGEPVPCSLRLDALGVPDPPHALASWGPGDEAWSAEYFAESPTVELRNGPVLVLSTATAVGVELSTSGKPLAHCSYVQRADSGNQTIRTGGATGAIANTRLTRSSALRQYGYPAAAAVVFSFRESFPAGALCDAPPREALVKASRQRLAQHQAAALSALAERGLGTIKALKQATRATADERPPPEPVPDRNSIKPPFWLRCDADVGFLRGALTAVFK